MTNEEMQIRLNSIEKVIMESFEKLNQSMTAIESGFERDQERFDVLEEHVVMLVDIIGG
ncbi:hypothetical protein MHI02_05745 [Oceanobacillus sp. FSL K6-0118]|uniref:hypothetical protein n=1 Tax=Oceanobacillus sp. FSL K6-0118 TaxID=2921418 RepID=UPI0030F61DAB